MKKYFLICIALIFVAWPVEAHLPSDPLYLEQSFYFNYLNMPAAWEIAQGDKVVVAVLDSGVDINHPDLRFNIWRNGHEIAADGIDNDNNGYIDDTAGWDFVDNDNDASPVADVGYDKLSLHHGTALAGIIGAVANNGVGLTGIAFNSKIMPIRILKSDGEGLVSNLVSAINYAVKNGADIINLSLVGFEKSSELENAIALAHRNGVLVVAASGNTEIGQAARDLDSEPAYPVCYGSSQDNIVLGVAAIGVSDQKSPFSSYGANCVDLSALGEDIMSLAYYNPAIELNDYYSRHWYGTSFSTAIISGMAALIKSKNLALSATDIINLLLNSAENIDALNPGYEGKLGVGKVDIVKALNSSIKFSGKLVKLATDSAVYYVNQDNTRFLFPNQNVFFSWYSGDWTDQGVVIISQEVFDLLSIGKNITLRPGTKLIKFQNSGRVYAVSPGAILHYLDSVTLTKMYPAYNDRLVTMQNSFESDYSRDGDLDGSSYPDGSLIKYTNSETIWYILNGQKREFTENSFALNNYKDQDIIKNVSSDFSYNIDTPIKNLNLTLYPYFK